MSKPIHLTTQVLSSLCLSPLEHDSSCPAADLSEESVSPLSNSPCGILVGVSGSESDLVQVESWQYRGGKLGLDSLDFVQLRGAG